MSPKFRYLAYAWTSNTSQGLTSQVVLGGNLNYTVNPHLTVGGGIDALPGVRGPGRGGGPLLSGVRDTAHHAAARREAIRPTLLPLPELQQRSRHRPGPAQLYVPLL